MAINEGGSDADLPHWECQALTRLLLRDNSLAELPCEPAAWRSIGEALEILDVSHNRLTGLPLSMRGLDRLKSLSVSHNALQAEQIPDAIFDSFPGLADVNFSHNHQLSELPSSLPLLANLAALSAAHCALDSLPHRFGQPIEPDADANSTVASSVFGAPAPLPRHHHSRVSNADVMPGARRQTAPSSCFVPCGPSRPVPCQLVTLDLGGNKLSTLPPGLAVPCTGSPLFPLLATVDLSANRIARFPAGLARGAPRLTALNLRDNDIRALDPSDFEPGCFSQLCDLFLGANALTTLPPEVFALPALTTLDCGTNHLQDLVPPGSEALIVTEHGASVLKTLDISNNDLAALPADLGLLPLDRLILDGNPLRRMRSVVGTGPKATRAALQYLRTRLDPEDPRLRRFHGARATAVEDDHAELMRRVRSVAIRRQDAEPAFSVGLPPTAAAPESRYSQPRPRGDPSRYTSSVASTASSPAISRRVAPLPGAPARDLVTSLSLSGMGLFALPDDAFADPDLIDQLQTLMADGNYLGVPEAAVESARRGPQFRAVGAGRAGAGAPRIRLPADAPIVLPSVCLAALIDNAARFRSLTTIDLSNNHLTALPGAALARIRGLRVLKAGRNRLSALPPELGRLVSLEELHVPCNALCNGNADGWSDAASALDLSGLPRLRVLDVSNNGLTALPFGIPRSGRALTLTSVLAHDNRISCLPTGPMPLNEFLPDLQELHLSNNDLADLPSALGAIGPLRVLKLEGNRLRMLRQSTLSRGTEAVKAWLVARGQR
jgi:Leucine-rich repeat (LRR) protein